MAIAQPHTPGLTQTVMSLLALPLVIAFSWCALGKRPSIVASVAAVLIVGGAMASSLRKVLGPIRHREPVVVYTWAICIFLRDGVRTLRP